MNRRNFIVSVGAVAAAGTLPSSAFANVAAAASKPLFSGPPRMTPLRGFAGQDVMCERAAIEGKLPAALRGVFYRNGPGLFERGVGANAQRPCGLRR